MKKLLCPILSLLFCCAIVVASSTTIWNTQPHTVIQDAGTLLFLNGNPVATTNDEGRLEPPVIFNGTTYVRLNGVKQLLGVDIEFDSDTNTVSIKNKIEERPVSLDSAKDPGVKDIIWNDIDRSKTIELYEHRGIRFINDNVILEDLIILSDGSSVFLPLRTIATELGYTVKWNTVLDGIDIMSPSFYSSIQEFEQGVGDHILIEDNNVAGVRSYILLNDYRDSSHVVKFKATRTKGNDCIKLYIDRQQQSSILNDRKKSQEVINSIIDKLQLNCLSDHDKVDKINSWVCSTYSYDTSVTEKNPLDGARTLKEILATDKQICEGYARLSVELCRAAGINAQYILGYVYIEGKWQSHAWYRTFINGEWLYTDPTLCDKSNTKRVALLKTGDELRAIRDDSAIRVTY